MGRLTQRFPPVQAHSLLGLRKRFAGDHAGLRRTLVEDPPHPVRIIHVLLGALTVRRKGIRDVVGKNSLAVGSVKILI